MLLEAARGWLTPAVLFVFVNLVIATIAVASRLMPPAADERRRGLLLRAPSMAVDRLRASLSFSRLGLAADHAPLFGDDVVVAPDPEPSSPRATAAGDDGREAERERGAEARIERSRSEAAAEAAPASSNNRRPWARRTRRAAAEEEPAVEVDARADDFIRRFREQLRLQRLDSILRCRDTLRRTGTA